MKCGDYDVIELVCVYRYPLTLTMDTGEVIDCVAKTTGLNAAREACIVVQIKGVERALVLDNIATLEVRVSNPHVQIIHFK